GGGRRAEAAQPGRDAAAVGARLPDHVAPRDGVLLPAQARARDAGAERVLRSAFPARPGARGRVPDGRLPARPPRGPRYGRALRRGLLHVQRGDGLVLPLPAGGLERALLPGRGVRPRRRRDDLAELGADVPRAAPRTPALPCEASRA